MRIGTWNLAGRWSEDHLTLMLEADCDAWLLTEVSERFDLTGHELHLGTASMAPRRRWAGVASRLPLQAAPDPHPASVSVHIGPTTYVSSVLPWRACGSEHPWIGDRHVDKTENALTELLPHLQEAESLVWGGDWNHALIDQEYAGSQGGRRAILEAVAQLELEVPTTRLPHHIEGLFTIDHVAVRTGLSASGERISAEHDGKRLSDHDAYAVEVSFPRHSSSRHGERVSRSLVSEFVTRAGASPASDPLR